MIKNKLNKNQLPDIAESVLQQDSASSAIQLVAPKSSKSDQQLKQDLQKQKIKDIKQNRELRQKYADRSFYFVVVYSFVVLVVFVYTLCSIGRGWWDLAVPSLPLSALVSTVTAAMVLFGWVLQGLFSRWGVSEHSNSDGRGR